jgi:hypothetical protein
MPTQAAISNKAASDVGLELGRRAGAQDLTQRRAYWLAENADHDAAENQGGE